jgi:hypothetical protein
MLFPSVFGFGIFRIAAQNENAPTFLLVHFLTCNGADSVIVAEASTKDPLQRFLTGLLCHAKLNQQCVTLTIRDVATHRFCECNHLDQI